jgi:hypothetical protein
MEGEKLQRLLVLLGLLALTSCRERASVCGTTGCAEVIGGAGGDAGRGGIGGNGGVGASGNEAGEAGRENASGAPGSAGAGGDEADGGSAGAEGGNAGAEGGDAGAGGAAMPSQCERCAPGLRCVEQDTGGSSCEYPNPGRWLVFSGNDKGGELPVELRALRLEGTKPSASLLLSEGGVGDHFQGESWSPDGRHLIAFGFSFDDLSTNTLLHVEFGGGLPSARVSLPGLPVSGARMTRPVWASDSSRFLIENVRSSPELYLVRFTSEGIRTELLLEEAETYDLAFCKNPRWFIRQMLDDAGQFETRLVDSENPTEERDLWPGITSVSPDGRVLIGSDYDTGLRRATCEGGTEVVALSDRPASDLAWSDDSRFVIVPYDDGEIAALDASDFQRVFNAYAAEHSWPWGHVLSARTSRLVVFGASELGGECEVIDVNLAMTPPQVSRRGSCPETYLPGNGSWGLLENGSIWALSESPDELRSLWLLEPGEVVWRPIAAGLFDTYPDFTPDENFVIFNNEQADGTIETLAFSLLEPEPTAMALQPAPAPYVTTSYFYAGGVILNGGDADERPYSGQLWWAPLGPSGFGAVVPLADVSFAASPRLQPER